jgi:hypothetical protein
MIASQEDVSGKSKFPLLDISDDKVFFIKQGIELQTAVYEKVSALKQSLAAAINKINTIIGTKDEAVTLMVALVNPDKDALNQEGLAVQALVVYANSLMREIESLSRVAKNLRGEYLYKLTTADAKRYGL